MLIATKQAQAAHQTAASKLSDALRLYQASETHMQKTLGASRKADELATVSGNAQDVAAAGIAGKEADMAVKNFKAANRAYQAAMKAEQRARAAYQKAQKTQDTKAQKEKDAATDATKGRHKAKPLSEAAVRLMVVEYVSGNAANAEAARNLDVARKDNAAKLKAVAAAIPSQDRLIGWALDIVKAAYAEDQARNDGVHKCKDRVAALKRLGAAYISANEATMSGLVFAITALDRKGNYAVKFEAAKEETDAEKADKAEKQAAKDWEAFITLGAQFGITEAVLIAAKAKAEADAEAAKAAKLAKRKAAKVAKLAA